MPMEPPSILEMVLRVALCQPASCNWTAKSSCVQPLRWRSLITCRPIKFSFLEFNSSKSSHKSQGSLCSCYTKLSLCFLSQIHRWASGNHMALRLSFISCMWLADPQSHGGQDWNKAHFQ